MTDPTPEELEQVMEWAQWYECGAPSSPSCDMPRASLIARALLAEHADARRWRSWQNRFTPTELMGTNWTLDSWNDYADRLADEQEARDDH